MLFALADKECFVLALTRDRFDWKRIPLGADALSQKVAAFRRGLDVGKASDASGKSGLFDLALANELYATLLGPVEALVKDKRSLLVAPSGALTALPFHLLVTEKPARCDPRQDRGLSQRGLAVEAAGGVGAAVGLQPEGAARLRAAGSGDKADDRLRRSRVQSVRGRRRTAHAPRAASPTSPTPISGRAPASIAAGSRRPCRNCLTPPTN